MFRRFRLSVSPVTNQQWNFISSLLTQHIPKQVLQTLKKEKQVSSASNTQQTQQKQSEIVDISPQVQTTKQKRKTMSAIEPQHLTSAQTTTTKKIKSSQAPNTNDSAPSAKYSSDHKSVTVQDNSPLSCSTVELVSGSVVPQKKTVSRRSTRNNK